MGIPCRFMVASRVEVPCSYEGCTRPGCTSTRYAYATPAGEPIVERQPGDVFFVMAHHIGADYCWEGCDGRHLICIIPSARGPHWWDIDARANNCTAKGDRNHRCWIRHGDPASGQLTVDKQGKTCEAGGGSIAVDGYHGFLRGFELVDA